MNWAVAYIQYIYICSNSWLERNVFVAVLLKSHPKDALGRASLWRLQAPTQLAEFEDKNVLQMGGSLVG